MSNPHFRFVHAGDLHLERPPAGLTEIPEHLRDLFLESAYWAAERVFETALAEEAEFLVLSGDVLHPQRTGPRGPLFLVEQFERLAERSIPIYWAGGRVDPPEDWPSGFPMPKNVYRYPRGRVDDFLCERDGTALARVMGTSRDRHRSVRAADFSPDPAGLFSIAVAHGSAQPAELSDRRVHYWALGGQHNRRTLFDAPHVAHYPGSPQGRRPKECGIHGCTLVQVDPRRRARTSLIPTDAVRWLSERVVVNEETSRDDLARLLRERMLALIEAAPGQDLLVCWSVAGNGPLLAQLGQGAWAAELLGALRQEYGFGPPAAWSVCLEVEQSTPLPPEWYEQETIRGDFLRAIRQLQTCETEPLELEAYVDESHLGGPLGAVAAVPEGATRERVLREAALLGANLLSGEEPRS